MLLAIISLVWCVGCCWQSYTWDILYMRYTQPIHQTYIYIRQPTHETYISYTWDIHIHQTTYTSASAVYVVAGNHKSLCGGFFVFMSLFDKVFPRVEICSHVFRSYIWVLSLCLLCHDIRQNTKDMTWDTRLDIVVSLSLLCASCIHESLW